MKKKKSFPKKKTQNHKEIIQSFLYVIISFFVAVLLYQLGIFHGLLRSFHEFGYIGVFAAGMFFVSIFTAAPAGTILLTFTETLPVFYVAIVGGFGAVMGDMFILHVLRQGIDNPISFFPGDKGIKKIIRLLRHTKYRFVLTIVGALVIASPLPDELGLTLMGITKMKLIPLLTITFLLNTLGIYLLLIFFK